jgi:hypothetical protein
MQVFRSCVQAKRMQVHWHVPAERTCCACIGTCACVSVCVYACANVHVYELVCVGLTAICSAKHVHAHVLTFVS